MSSILKALEKAEESGNSKRMAGDSSVIRSNRRRAGWVLPAAILCGAGVAALVTFVAMGGFSRHKSAAQAPAVVKADTVSVPPMNVVPEGAPVQPAPQLPAVSQPVSAPVAAPAAPVAKPAPKASPKATAKLTPPAVAKPAPAVAASAAPAARKAALAAGGKPAASNATASKTVRARAHSVPAAIAAKPAPVVRVAPVAPAAAPAAPARPHLKVSGIAYQESGEASFAVVNGRAVLQGGTIDGYKVLEIRHDTVKFSGSGGTFEVPMEAEE